MTCYSVHPKDKIFVKDYGFLSFAKNKGKNIGKNIRKNLSSKFGRKPLDHARQSTADPFKTALKRGTQKTEEAAGDLIDNKIADKIIRVSKTSHTK